MNIWIQVFWKSKNELANKNLKQNYISQKFSKSANIAVTLIIGKLSKLAIYVQP